MAEFDLHEYLSNKPGFSSSKRSRDWLEEARVQATLTRHKRGRTDSTVEFGLDYNAQPELSIEEINLHEDTLSSQSISLTITGSPTVLNAFSSWYTDHFPNEEIEVTFSGPIDEDDPLFGQIDEEDVELVASKRDPRPSDDPLHAWKDFIDVFLDEFISLEGRGEFIMAAGCNECHAGQNTPIELYRCTDCCTDRLLCQKCLVDGHRFLPFHRIERWDEAGFFSPTTLMDLGLRIQLGHPVDHVCLLPEPAKNDGFVIIHESGIHEVGLDFCGCERAESHVTQLLRARLFPATTDMPATAATFNVLKRFEILSYESKASAYQYYRSLVRETNNIDEDAVKARYRELLRIVREYALLKMLKRAGRGHDILGALGTQEGECALLCPACPHELWNLPEHWKNAPKEERWKYTLFVALDANFRLRRKLISNETKDPALCQGYAYFVKTEPYLAHLEEQNAIKQPRSTCVSHDAVNDADTKDVHGCSVSGLGAVDCARHGFRRPNSVGDLQKGERYVNMDYLFNSSLKNTEYRRLVGSYDIACQWRTNLPERTEAKFPNAWYINNPDVEVTLLVPKFHLPAHIEKCHREFSFNLTRYVGRTDGEAVERNWSKTNHLAASTREMGPGARRDKIEAHMGDDNWKITIRMGRALFNGLDTASIGRAKQAKVLAQFERVIPSETLAIWRSEVELWEEDPSQPNPYESREKDMTQADVRLLLAQQDAKDPDPNGVIPVSGITGSSMITMGLELEALQRRFHDDASALGQHPTSLQQAKIQERSNALRRRITQWYEVLALHIPGTALLRNLDERRRPASSGEVKVHNMRLYLPSDIASQCDCDSHLQESEWIIREAQARDALDSLRSHLRIESYVTKRKRDHVRGVRANTRSQALIKRNRAKVKIAVDKYRAAHAALKSLAKVLQRPDSALDAFKELKDTDIAPLSAVQAVGEGQKKLSWVWMAEGIVEGNDNPDDPQLKDALRIQWLRARARVMRFEEEIKLIQEEMRRVLAYFRTRAAWWEERGTLRRGLVGSALEEGLRAYATHQAWIYRDLARRCELKWAGAAEVIARATVDEDSDDGEENADDSTSHT